MFYYNIVYSLDGSCDEGLFSGKDCPDIPSVDIPDNYEYRIVH